MLGDRHPFGTGQVDQPAKPYFASFALRVFMRLPALARSTNTILARGAILPQLRGRIYDCV